MYFSFSQEVSVCVHTLCTRFGLGNKYILTILQSPILYFSEAILYILPFHFSITMEDLFGPMMGYEMD
jgi:hypothetical protein